MQTYNALAQQEAIFKENEFFINPEFMNFNLTENGMVGVDFASKIDPSLISYKKAVETQPVEQ